MHSLTEQDYEWIAAGAYRMPWDMTTLNKQFSPAFWAQRTIAFLDEGVATLKRRTRNTPDPIWLRGNSYPQVGLFVCV